MSGRRMHPQLTLLLEIQDLQTQRQELVEGGEVEDVEVTHFRIDPVEAIEALDEKIEELKGQLDPPVRARFERGLVNLGRMVVPVINGVCYGCFVSIPTARSGEPNVELEICQNCGRFIYVLT